MDNERPIRHLPPGAVFRHGGLVWVIPEPNEYTRRVANAPEVVAMRVDTGSAPWCGPWITVFSGTQHVTPIPGARITFYSPSAPHPAVDVEALGPDGCRE